MKTRDAIDAVFDASGRRMDAPKITGDEVYQILVTHRQIEEFVPRPLPEMMAQYTPADLTPMQTRQVCAECGKEWGSFGCPTIRLLKALSHAETQQRRAEVRLSNAYIALGALSVHGGWELNKREQGVLSINFEIDRQTLMHTGHEPVVHFFAKIIREIRERFEKHCDSLQEEREVEE
jgi:hypothetical protein